LLIAAYKKTIKIQGAEAKNIVAEVNINDKDTTKK
jgi:hypothetical protein